MSSIALFAALADKPEELNDAIIAPLQKGFEVEKGNIVKVEQVDLPIVRAKFRVLWRECAKKEGLASLLPSITIVQWSRQMLRALRPSSPTSPSKNSKELRSMSQCLCGRYSQEVSTGNAPGGRVDLSARGQRDEDHAAYRGRPAGNRAGPLLQCSGGTQPPKRSSQEE